MIRVFDTCVCVSRVCVARCMQVLATMRGGEGYGFTALAMAEAGIALATQRDTLPALAVGPGFLTPATAFGSVLVRRLQAAGVQLTVSSK